MVQQGHRARSNTETGRQLKDAARCKSLGGHIQGGRSQKTRRQQSLRRTDVRRLTRKGVQSGGYTSAEALTVLGPSRVLLAGWRAARTAAPKRKPLLQRGSDEFVPRQGPFGHSSPAFRV